MKKVKIFHTGGGEIGKVHRIDVSSFDSRIKDCDFIIASDVQNPLVGEMGASRVFGPQKGADNNMVEMLDQNMTHWADEIEKVTGIHLHNRSGGQERLEASVEHSKPFFQQP
ncbi:glycerate kinase [Guptibacillus hwajinpoensis]|uniref:glycerate kinase n=1 Tax=Guptibacillus hwajinpoensis TaxID=208199 RepID=UPI003514EAEB